MTPKPLKKEMILTIDSEAVSDVVKPNTKMMFYRDYKEYQNNIDSAVEWLKKELNDKFGDIQLEYIEFPEIFNKIKKVQDKIIREAFENN